MGRQVQAGSASAAGGIRFGRSLVVVTVGSYRIWGDGRGNAGSVPFRRTSGATSLTIERSTAPQPGQSHVPRQPPQTCQPPDGTSMSSCWSQGVSEAIFLEGFCCVALTLVETSLRVFHQECACVPSWKEDRGARCRIDGAPEAARQVSAVAAGGRQHHDQGGGG